MTNISDRLKSCPFCGCHVVMICGEVCGYTKYTIRCCNVNIVKSTPEGAIERWNTRNKPDQQTIDDVKLLRSAASNFILSLPSQAEGHYLDALREALSMTDCPQYKEVQGV